MLYALYRRYLYRRSLAEVIDGALRIGLIGAVSLGVWLVSGLPFGLGPVSLVRFYSDVGIDHAVHERERLQPLGRLRILAQRLGRRPRRRRFAGISALPHRRCCSSPSQPVVVLWQIHRGDRARRATRRARSRSPPQASRLLAFALLTRMHERYMFLALVFFAPLVFVRPLRLAYAALSALFLLNLWYPYAFFNTRWWHVQGFHFDPWFDWLFGGFVDRHVAEEGLVARRHGDRARRRLARRPLGRDVRAAAGERSRRRRAGDRCRRGAGSAARARRAAGASPGARPPPRDGLALGAARARRRSRASSASSSSAARRRTAVNLNDSAFHLQMVRWAGGQIREGRVPLDGWYPYLSLGSSFFHHYQSLPHTLTAYVARVDRRGRPDDLPLDPVPAARAVADLGLLAARLLGWGRWTAAAAAAVSPLVVSASGYGYEHGELHVAGLRRVLAALGDVAAAARLGADVAGGDARHVLRGGRARARAHDGVPLHHGLPGGADRRRLGARRAGAGFLRRAGRAALVVVGSVLIAVLGARAARSATRSGRRRASSTQGSIFNDSYGAQKVLGWLVHGRALRLRAASRSSRCSSPSASSSAPSQARRDLRARALLGAFVLSLLLFFGRPTLGPRARPPPRLPATSRSTAS